MSPGLALLMVCLIGGASFAGLLWLSVRHLDRLSPEDRRKALEAEREHRHGGIS